MNDIFKIRGNVRSYNWGGYNFLADLLGADNTEAQPQAEYWLGAHPSCPSTICDESSQEADLFALVSSNPSEMLSERIFKRFEALPFLFKVLDVRDMLSIQVHPSKASAEEGFADENKRGIPIDAPNRNYRDQNHKPELMVALGEFWLLHGFQSQEDVMTRLQTRDYYAPMRNTLAESGVQGLFEWTITAPSEETDIIIDALLASLESEPCTDKADPEYWIHKWVQTPGATRTGLLVILLMNVLKANEGEAVFQGAGIIHAYLEGQNIEIMANSDNVLRGGLTEKHMDAPELIKHTTFEAINPQNSLVPPTAVSDFEHSFNAPIEDFILSEIKIPNGQSAPIKSDGLEVFFCLAGQAQATSKTTSSTLDIGQGASFAALPGSSFEISSKDNSLRIFRAKTNF